MSRHRIIIPFAALLGAAGVFLAAAASHGEDARLFGSASAMCLAHAPALLAIAALAGRLRLAVPAALLIGLGTLLFSGDLVWRTYAGTGMLPMAAPAGGLGMIGGWLVLAVGGVLSERP